MKKRNIINVSVWLLVIFGVGMAQAEIRLSTDRLTSGYSLKKECYSQNDAAGDASDYAKLIYNEESSCSTNSIKLYGGWYAIDRAGWYIDFGGASSVVYNASNCPNSDLVLSLVHDHSSRESWNEDESDHQYNYYSNYTVRSSCE